MHHIAYDNIIEFWIYITIRDFCINDIIDIFNISDLVIMIHDQ